MDKTEEQNLMELLEKFNESDVSPMLTRDSVLSGFKSKPRTYTKKEAQEVFGEEELTDEDIQALREEAEAKLALKRGLISLSEFNKTIVKNKDKLKEAHKSPRPKARGLAKVAKSVSKTKGVSKEIQNLVDSVKPQTLVRGKPVGNIPQRRASLKSTPLVNYEDKLDYGSEEKFETDFLFSTKGKLNGDVLLDILIDTWNYKSQSALTGEEENSSFLGKLGKAILKYTGLLAFFKGARKLLSKAYKGFKGKLKNAFKGLKNAFKAIFVDPVVNAFKALKEKLLGWLKKGKEALKNLARKTADGAKKAYGAAKAAVKGAAKAAKNFFKSKQMIEKEAKAAVKEAAKKINKKASKEVAKQVAKEVAKQSSKQTAKNVAKKAAKSAAKPAAEKASKSLLKGAINKVPVIGTMIDLGFMEMDVRDKMKSGNKTREQAYDEYVDELKNDFGRWDWADPLKISQNFATIIGADKVGGWIGDKVGDLMSWATYGSESPVERMQKYKAESMRRFGNVLPAQSLMSPQESLALIDKYKKKYGIAQNQNQTMTPIPPDFIKNPNLRVREPQITYIEKEKSSHQNMTPLPNFNKDTNEPPISGFGYLGEY